MAKKYNVTFANGTEQVVNSKKAVKALEGILKVTVDGQDITNEFVKEDEVMAENKNIAIEAEAQENEYVEVVEAIEAVEEAQAEVEAIEAPEGPKATLLFTASRGNAKRLAWRQIIVNPEDETIKVKGCAAMLPIQVAEAIGSTKFVSWFDQEQAEKCVAEGKQVRGMASTFSDIFARYTKVNEIKGADKLETVLNIFQGILNDIEAGITEGEWARPEPEVPEEVEAPETADVISTAIEDIEVA
jgi:hypothetical protein